MAEEIARTRNELAAALAKIGTLTDQRDSLSRELGCARLQIDIAVEQRRAAEHELTEARRERAKSPSPTAAFDPRGTDLFRDAYRHALASPSAIGLHSKSKSS